MKKEKKAFLSGVLVLTSFNLLLAQESDSTKQLNPVVVTANRYDTRPEETPKSVTVITSEELQQSVYQNVGELLTSQEGLYVVGAYQNPGMNQTIFSRGTNSNQMVIMIDGVRITDPSSNSNATDLSELSLTNVERIEIVRGAQSTLYGSSAIGGVINIITNKKSDYKNGLGVNATLNGGTFSKGASLHDENVALNYSTKKGLYFNASTFYMGVNGMDATLDTVTDPNAFKNRDKDNFSKFDYALKGGYQQGKWDLFIGYKSTSQSTDLDAGAYTDDENYTLKFKRNIISNSLYYRFSDHLKIGVVGGGNSMSRTIVNDSSLIAPNTYDNAYYTADYNGTTINEDLLIDYQHKYFHLLAGGGYYEEKMNARSDYLNTAFNYESISNNDTADLHLITNNAFAQIQLDGKNFSKKLEGVSLTAGTRMNMNNLFGNYFTYEIAPSVKTSEKGMIYFSWSTGFNNPSLYQLYSPEKNYISNISRGNPNLTPEKATTFEVGYKQQFGKNSFFTLSYFNNTINNEIEYVYLWDKNVGIDTLGNDWTRDDYRGDTYINLGTLKSNGVEFSVHANISEKLFADANATIVNGKLIFDPANINLSNTDSNHVQLYSYGIFLQQKSTIYGLTRRPNTARITFGYKPIKSLTIMSTIRMAGVRGDVFYDYQLGPYGALNTTVVGDYTLWDLSINYQLKSAVIKFKAENILDKKYSEINGYATRGRGFYLSLSIRI